MQNEEIRERIASFPRWHYRFNLNGNLTPIFDSRMLSRHRHRKEYFFDPLVSLCGGSLEGKRILDLGCNAGWWSLRAAAAGADYVLGVDGRKMHIDQANFVFEVKGINKKRYDFIEANLFDADWSSWGQFDIVLCLGLLYHVSKPMELMEAINGVSTDLLIIDTSLSRKEGALFEVRHDRLDEPRDAVDYEFVLWPSRQAVVDLARQFGYQIVIPKPDFRNSKGAEDYRAAHDYKGGWRRAFMCAKETDLSALNVEVESD